MLVLFSNNTNIIFRSVKVDVAENSIQFIIYLIILCLRYQSQNFNHRVTILSNITSKYQ